MYNHNKAQQSKNRVHISWDILYVNATRKRVIRRIACDIHGLVDTICVLMHAFFSGDLFVLMAYVMEHGSYPNLSGMFLCQSEMRRLMKYMYIQMSNMEFSEYEFGRISLFTHEYLYERHKDFKYWYL